MAATLSGGDAGAGHPDGLRAGRNAEAIDSTTCYAVKDPQAGDSIFTPERWPSG